MKKVLSVIGNVLLVIIVLVAVTLTFMSLNTNDKGVPEIGGYILLNIQSASMEPTIMTGDFILTKKVDDANTLAKGDIISFLATEGETTIIKTHRIVSIDEMSGIKVYTTKGDNNPVEDEDFVVNENIVSKYTNFRIPLIGKLLTFLSGRVGFFVFIVFPLFVLFVYQIYKFISAVVEEKKQELIRKIREEQQKENQAN